MQDELSAQVRDFGGMFRLLAPAACPNFDGVQPRPIPHVDSMKTLCFPACLEKGCFTKCWGGLEDGRCPDSSRLGWQHVCETRAKQSQASEGARESCAPATLVETHVLASFQDPHRSKTSSTRLERVSRLSAATGMRPLRVTILVTDVIVGPRGEVLQRGNERRS